MAVNMLLITHPGIGEALKKTVSVLLCNHLPTRVETLSVPWQGAIDDILPATRLLCDELKRDADGVLILSDLFGATPANIATQLAKAYDAHIVCGLNLPMLLKALNYCHLAPEVVAEKAYCGGSEGIVKDILNDDKKSSHYCE